MKNKRMAKKMVDGLYGVGWSGYKASIGPASLEKTDVVMQPQLYGKRGRRQGWGV